MRRLFLVLLLTSPLVLSASDRKPKLKPLEEITGPANETEACQALIDRVVEERLFPYISKECFRCELERNTGRTFEFALRFNQAKCGGDSASTLFDRFLVCSQSPVMLWYDSANDRYLPWEYAHTTAKRGRRDGAH
jgi:hypothetical protein